MQKKHLLAQQFEVIITLAIPATEFDLVSVTLMAVVGARDNEQFRGKAKVTSTHRRRRASFSFGPCFRES